MISSGNLCDELYDAAFRLKKAKGWRLLEEQNIVAVRTLHDGTWFCCVMMNDGSSPDICVYDDQQGVNVMRQILDVKLQEDYDDYARIELLLSYNGYLIGYAPRRLLQGQASEQRLLDYCKRKKLKAGGKNFYPLLKVMRPRHVAWCLQDEKDIRIATAIMKAFCLIDDVFLQKSPVPKLVHFDDKLMVPVISEKEDGDFSFGRLPLPKFRESAFFSPDWNDLQAARLKKVKKTSDVWTADCFLMLHGVVGEDDPPEDGSVPAQVPFYPEALVVLDDATDAMLMMDLSGEDADYGRILDGLYNLILSEGRPRQILVSSRKTEKFLKKLCRRLDIRLVFEQFLPELEDIRDDLLNGWDGMDDFEDGGVQDFDMMDVPDEEIEKLMCEDFTRMVRSGGLSELVNAAFADAVDFCLCHAQLAHDVVELVQMEYRRRRDKGMVGRLKFSGVLLR